MLFALGFIALFTIGGLTGVVLANASLDVALHDTVWIVFFEQFILDLFSILSTVLFMSSLSMNLNMNHNVKTDKNNEYIKMF
jgi:cytochrome c oxidase subunit 1